MEGVTVTLEAATGCSVKTSTMHQFTGTLPVRVRVRERERERECVCVCV